MRDFDDDNVERAFDAFPAIERGHLMRIRERVFEVAERDARIGDIIETLKWGQPAYLTANKSGSTIRLGVPKSGGYAIYVHCQTSLIADFKVLFEGDFEFEGNRAVVFDAGEEAPLDKLEILIGNALSYHARRG